MHTLLCAYVLIIKKSATDITYMGILGIYLEILPSQVNLIKKQQMHALFSELQKAHVKSNFKKIEFNKIVSVEVGAYNLRGYSGYF